MLSLFLNPRAATARRIGFAIVGLVGMSGTTLAAEVYLQPQGEAMVDVDTNRALVTSGNTSAQKITSEGYIAQAGATLGVFTPVSDTTLKGQVGYQDYPKYNDHEWQTTADLATEYRWQRATFTAFGQFDRLDTFSSELASALFNPIVPVSPTTPETARLSVDTTRTLANFVPKYDYRLSERLSVGISGVVEDTYYSGQFASNYNSYVYGQGFVFLGYAVSPRLDVAVGPYVSRSVARIGEASTTGTGGSLEFTFKWSKIFSGRLAISGESDDNTIDQGTGIVTKVRTDAVGATYTNRWTGQISQLQVLVGRQLTPSGLGGVYFADQLQVEYNRKLTPRLDATAAVLLIDYTPSVETAQSAPYKYVDATVGLKWLLTRTWHLDTGVEFLRVDYGTVNNGTAAAAANSGVADNFRFYLGFGYTGLGRKSTPFYR